jgi:hypothetical protein
MPRPAVNIPVDELPIYDLLADAEGWELSGPALENELRYPLTEDGIESAKRMVGFLSQVTGAELRIHGAGSAGIIETKTYRRGVRPTKNDLGDV